MSLPTVTIENNRGEWTLQEKWPSGPLKFIHVLVDEDQFLEDETSWTACT
jgi:hypothetical protein